MRITNVAQWFDKLFTVKLHNTVFYPFKPINRQVEIERGTIRHMCAVDSLMEIISSTNDYDTFTDNGDLELYIDYVKRVDANKKAIRKEESQDLIY